MLYIQRETENLAALLEEQNAKVHLSIYEYQEKERNVQDFERQN